MNESKMHHYVPQAYLKFFAKQELLCGKERYWLSVYDKKSYKQYPLNVSNAAAEKYYNRLKLSECILPPPESDPLYYEKKYIDLIEGRLPNIIRNLMARCTLSVKGARVLTPAVKDDLANLIIVQSLRTPDVRSYLGKIGEKSYHQIMTTARWLVAQIPDEIRRTDQMARLDKLVYTDEFKKSGHLLCTTDPERLTGIKNALIEDHIWIIYRNMTGCRCITSDVPVVFFGLDDRSVGFGTNGIAQPTTVIIMPLTPEYLVAIYHADSLVGQYTDLNDQCISLDYSKKRFIEHINQLQFKNCWRQVYTHPDDEFPDFPQ